jgi:hypothetical protein
MRIGIYVDDCLVIGAEERIAKLIFDLKKHGFNLKVENSLFELSRDRNQEFDSNHDLIATFNQQFSG